MILDESTLKDKIYTIRGQQVMLDFDLAEIYGYETKNFNRQVKNNIERFEGEDFMFRLTKEEYDNLRCKNFTSRWGGSRYLPYAFTEQGIYLLMTVLIGVFTGAPGGTKETIEYAKKNGREVVVINRYK